ncbi:MAG: ABC transporter permease/substrate-binding protein [Planctomycetota bacterium]
MTLREHLAEIFARLPELVSAHLVLSTVAIAVGAAISVPLGVAAARRAAVRGPVLASVGLVQAIPGIALLALMVPLLVVVGTATTSIAGVEIPPLGFWPALLALTLYSMLPMVRNTVTGLESLDPAVLEAATAMGMTPRQRLRMVELPLAMPVLVAGLRTATVWTVGMATLATPVGGRSLGEFIFAGLQTRNWTMVIVGCAASAVLAIGLDLLIGLLERAAKARRGRLGSLLLLAVAIGGGIAWPALVVEGDNGPSATTIAEDDRRLDRPIRIGAKTFTEQFLLARAVAAILEGAGYETEIVEGLGSTVMFDAIASGEIDVCVDYSGTLWATVLGRDAGPGADAVRREIAYRLAADHGILVLGSLGFENAYAVAVSRESAERLGLESIGDLAPHASELRFGGDYEFFARPEWRAIRDGYGLEFEEQVGLDSTFMYEACARGEVAAIAAFSSDGRIAALDLVTLDDPAGTIPPYEAVLLVGAAAADDPTLVDALETLVGSIDVELMREANLLVDREENSLSVDRAAAWLLERCGADDGDQPSPRRSTRTSSTGSPLE